MDSRKTKLTYGIVIGVLTVIVVFLAVKFGMAFDDLERYEDENLFGFERINVLMENIEKQIFNKPFRFRWGDNVRTSLIWCLIMWGFGCIYFLSTRKNYLGKGKAYGTSRWGNKNDIKDLFAKTLRDKALKQARRVRTPIGRFYEKIKVIVICIKNALKMRSMWMDRLSEWKEDELLKGNRIEAYRRVHKEYKERKEKINQDTKEWYRESLAQAWTPYRLECEFQKECADIEEKFKQGLSISSEEEKQDAISKAKNKYENALNDFYEGSKAVAKIKEKYENSDAIFTQTERICIHNYVLNNNTLCVGGSGAGKTRGFVMPNLLQAHSSYVCSDPKGEILEKSGYYLEKIKGYKIRVLNLVDMAKSDGYNPFVYVHPERRGYEARILSLIETIIANTDGGEKKEGIDPFWAKAERLFLQAIFFFTCDGFPPEERNMNTALSLIGMLELGDEDDECDSDLDYFAEIFAQNHGENHIGVQQYREFRTKSTGKTAKSIVISAVARLAPFRVPDVRRIFSYDSMQLDRLGEEKMAVFVVVPPTDDTYYFIAGMMFTQMFQELEHCALIEHKHDGQRLPVPVRFMLDEFATTSTIPRFPKILAYSRSLGVGICPIIQSFDQLKKLYHEEWSTIVDNCNTLLYLGSITHGETLEYVSKLLGKGTYDKKTTSRSWGQHGSRSVNNDEFGRELKDVAEIRTLKKEECLLIAGGRNPFCSLKYDYTSHPEYRYTSDKNHEYSYEYTPAQPSSVEDNEQEERTHREYELRVNAQGRADEIMREIDALPDEIKINPNFQKLLGFMGVNYQYLSPIRNEILNVDDGEDIDQMLMNALDFEAEDVAVNRTFEIAVADFDDELQVESNPKIVAETVLKRGKDFVPIRDDVLQVNDGEDVLTVSTSSSENPKVATDEQRSEENTGLENVENDTLENLENLLNELKKTFEKNV